MDANADHNAVLKRVARERLAPLGLIQKGRSRTWFDDRVWFVIMVEFQPSSYSRGSYLNVGASWLWWPAKDFLSFDDGYRVGDFEISETGDWSAKCAALADQAGERCLEIRQRFVDISAAASILNGESVTDGWRAAHAGMAAALAGDTSTARRRLARVQAAETLYDWEVELRDIAARLLGELDDLEMFREARIADIQSARSSARLPELDPDVIRAALETREVQGEDRPRCATALRGLLKRD